MNEGEAEPIRQRLADMRAALNTASADAADSRAPVELDQTSCRTTSNPKILEIVESSF